MAELTVSTPLNKVVVRFSGDSGDGMQLTGSLFSQSSGLAGNDLTTIPDFPAEIRAPQGSISGVSSYQVQFGGSEIYTPGDRTDILVAMNPAALAANLKILKSGAMIIVDADEFNRKNLKKADYESNPLEDDTLSDFRVIKAPITFMTKEALKDMGLDTKTIMRCRNMFALGLVYHLFSRPLESTLTYFEKKFAKKPEIAEANSKALQAGYSFAESTEINALSMHIPPARLRKGMYRNIDGNTAVAWGCLAAAEKTGKTLSLCSYPITPASEILHELSARKDLGAVVFQAEDEIAAVCASIGAAFAGNLSITTTSGPGASLKSEAMGLAVIAELPLVMVNVQRAGPSTGLPTKTEQADLFQALYGRHGEAPLIVLAASTPDDCFEFAYEACKLAMEHTTPVILLTDSYLSSGNSPWRITPPDELPDINIPEYKGTPEEWQPYQRNAEYLARFWKYPGQAGFEHRIGGLEKKEISGNLTYEPLNHELMVKLREEKVARVAKKLPKQKIYGPDTGKLLVVCWGSTYGSAKTAFTELLEEGHESIGFTHFNYIKPLPENTGELFSRFEELLVCEQNNGQFAAYLQTQYPSLNIKNYNKIQGQPFFVEEIKQKIRETLEESEYAG